MSRLVQNAAGRMVPVEINAWNPEMAPQATVMNTNGNRRPCTTRPLP